VRCRRGHLGIISKLPDLIPGRSQPNNARQVDRIGDAARLRPEVRCSLASRGLVRLREKCTEYLRGAGDFSQQLEGSREYKQA